MFSSNQPTFQSAGAPPPPAGASSTASPAAPAAPPPPSMAWDPKNPAALLLPVVIGGGGANTATAINKDIKKHSAMQINTILSHTGVGCNDHEITALMELIESHEKASNLKPISLRTSWNSIKTLSKCYRIALRECLSRWEDNLNELEQQDESMQVDDDDPTTKTTRGGAQQKQQQQQLPDLSMENLELTKLVFAICHLSEIFLLPPPAEEVAPAMDYYNDDLFAIPGALTADTVRYLRYHHSVNALQIVDPDTLQEVLNSYHPDQVDNGKPYWEIVYTLVKQGNLEQAWFFLMRHSAFRRACQATTTNNNNNNNNNKANTSTLDDYELQTLEQDKEGFMDLRNILLSAPIPGGRDDSDDGQMDGPSALNDDDKESSLYLDEPKQDYYLEGIHTDSYQMWETSRSTTEGRDFPVHYNPRAVSMKRNNWQQYVLELESVRRLKRKIPQLDGILNILSGNLRGIQFTSWAQALTTELIYQNPTILPTNIQIRASKLMQKWPRTPLREMDEVLLSVMEGNAGKVIEVLHAFGGGSGAALPATVTSLLCNLYVDYKIPIAEEFQMGLLKAAAFGISSSLGTANHSDTAAQLVVRLLLPYAKPSGDPSIVATLGKTLEHHHPSSDAEAHNLIDLCRNLVERKKSVVVLEGCVSLVLARYRKYLKDERPGGAIHWLLVGLELEASLYAVEKDGDIHNWQKVAASSVCYRHLVMWCNRISGALLSGIIRSIGTTGEEQEKEEGLGFIYATTKQMVASAKEGPLEGYATKLPEVKTLGLVLGIYDGLMDSEDWTSAARCITKCLEEEPNEFDDGVVASVAPRSMHWELLQLGHHVVETDEKRQSVARAGEYSPSFDVKGVQVLLEQLTIIPLSRELEGIEPPPSELVKKMQLSLGKALMRAFVAENARRKPNLSNEADEVLISQIRSVDLHKHSHRTQERVVQAMLDF